MKSALLQALPDGRAAYVEVLPPGPLNGPCFMWQGATNRKGYALRGRRLLHRAVYEEAHGPIAKRAVADGLIVRVEHGEYVLAEPR